MLQFASLASATKNSREHMSDTSAEIATRLTELARGCDEILPENGLAGKLSKGRSLIVKAGFDPTAPDTSGSPQFSKTLL